MRKYVFAAVAALALCGPAMAQVSCQRVGALQACNGFVNGRPYSSSEQTYGGLTAGQDTQGNHWSTQRYGNQSSTQFAPGRRY